MSLQLNSNSTSGFDYNLPVAATRSVAPTCMLESSYQALDNNTFRQNAVHAHTEAYKVLSNQEGATALAAKEQAAEFKNLLGKAKWSCECMPSTSLCKKTILFMIICGVVQPAEAMLVGNFAAEIVDHSLQTILHVVALIFFLQHGLKSWKMQLLLTFLSIITNVAAQDAAELRPYEFNGWTIFKNLTWFIFLLVDCFGPLYVIMWFWNKDHDRVEYPMGAPIKHWLLATSPFLLWLCIPFSTTGLWYWFHALVFSIVVPAALLYLGAQTWWTWMKPTGTALATVLDHGVVGAPAPIPNRVPASDPHFVEHRSQQRSIRKAVRTDLYYYHIKYCNETVPLCTDLINLCVLQYCRSNPTRAEIATYLKSLTQFNLSDLEWIDHDTYVPAIVQWLVREQRNKQAKIEDLSEELTNYDDLSVRDKQRKYRLFLHSFLGSKACLTWAKILVSYLIVAACIFLMFRFVSATYNFVDKVIDAPVVTSSKTVIYDMSFEEQSALRTAPALKPMKADFQWIAEPTQETVKKTKLVSIFNRSDMPLELGFHYDRRDAGNMKKAIEQRVAVTNVVSPLTAANATDGQVHYHPWFAMMHKHADELCELLRTMCLPPVFPTREQVVSWLQSRHYPQNRTKQILNAYDQSLSLVPSDLLKQRSGRVEAFIKEEYYPEFKNPRAILARGDLAKAILGPAFDQLNHLFFTLPETVKKLPASTRPKYIMERCSGPYYYVTDHTAFECSATAEIQRHLEMRIYKTLLGVDMHEYLDVLLETQYVKCGNGTAKVPASRFSGEMNTSLGNSITNYVFIKMIMDRFDITGNFFIEGDDGLLCFEQQLDVTAVANFARENGFNLKIDEVATPGDAGFLSTYWTTELYPYKKPLGKYLAGSAWKLPQSPLTSEDLMISRLASMIEENPQNDFLIHMYDSLCHLWNKTSENFVYKPDDNYFREKLDLQGVKYEHVAGLLKYALPKFVCLPSGPAFLKEHYHVSQERYVEIKQQIYASPIKAYSMLVSLFGQYDTKCTYMDYQLTW